VIAVTTSLSGVRWTVGSRVPALGFAVIPSSRASSHLEFAESFELASVAGAEARLEGRTVSVAIRGRDRELWSLNASPVQACDFVAALQAKETTA
jgi:hypothetical protein